MVRVIRPPAAELLLDLHADLGEGPVWDAASQRLLLVDIMAGKVHAFDPQSGGLQSWETESPVGCVVPAADGQLVAALADGIWKLDRTSGRRVLLARPGAHDSTRCRFNDGKCDPQGRLWAGTMGTAGEPGLGALYCFSPEGACRRVLDNVSVSNGLAWSLDGATLYYIDSPTRRVDAFDFDPSTGGLSHRRTAISFPPGRDVPDGCSLDAEGMLWIAHWDGGCVTRWDPSTGTHLGTISVPAPRVTCCTFGGATLDTLYITTARRGLDAHQLAAFPHAGGIFACHPGVRGTPTHVFGR